MHTICMRPAGAFPKPRRDAALATLSAHEVCTSGYPPIIFFCHPTFLFFFFQSVFGLCRYISRGCTFFHNFLGAAKGWGPWMFTPFSGLWPCLTPIFRKVPVRMVLWNGRIPVVKCNQCNIYLKNIQTMSGSSVACDAWTSTCASKRVTPLSVVQIWIS